MIGEWKHPGGKLREEGAQSLTEEELLAILISTGIPGKSAGEIAGEVLLKYGSLEGLSDNHKKVLELPIPQFDANNAAHRALSELGKSCAQKVSRWLSAGNAGNIKSIGRLRGMVRGMLKEELGEIDVLVKGILEDKINQ